MNLQKFDYSVAIRPQDIVGGHVYTSQYFAFIGETFLRWYTAMGFSETNRTGTALPLMAHLSLDYLREMVYPGTVLCRLIVQRVGKTSLEHLIEIRDADHPELLCGRGKAVNVWFDRSLGKAVSWPAEELAKCWNG